MMKIVIAPDSFKGTLSASQVCTIIASSLRERYPDCEITEIPIADGGEGTVEAYLHIFGGEKIFVKVKSPLMRDITAYYAMLSDMTAVIETAQASGLTLEKKNDAMKASTYGTGQLIADALDRGAKRIILGLGGSATTDGGAGCASALGAKFLDKNGNEIPYGGIGFESLRKLDLSGLDKRLKATPITALCDVENPLFGENGAAFVYSRQKGASDEEIVRLDGALRSFAEVCAEALGTDKSLMSGAGAAGGLGFCVNSLLGGRLQSGIDCILDAAHFEETAKQADLIITGEGKLDAQSLMGKAIGGITARSCGTKVIAVVGMLEASLDQVHALGLSQVIETNPLHRPFEEIKASAAEDLARAARIVIV